MCLFRQSESDKTFLKTLFEVLLFDLIMICQRFFEVIVHLPKSSCISRCVGILSKTCLVIIQTTSLLGHKETAVCIIGRAHKCAIKGGMEKKELMEKIKIISNSNGCVSKVVSIVSKIKYTFSQFTYHY